MKHLKVLFICLYAFHNINAVHEEIIEKAEKFPMERVLKRYTKDYKATQDEAVERGLELKRYLVMAVLKPGLNPAMFSEKVDDVWHTFLVHTKEYMMFCKTIAGHYIHHDPTDNPEEQDQAEVLEQKEKFVQAYTDIFKHAPPAHVWEKLHFGNSICNPSCQQNCVSTCKGSCQTRASCQTKDSNVYEPCGKVRLDEYPQHQDFIEMFRDGNKQY